MGQLEISEGQSSQTYIEFLQQWRRRWNVERGGPPIGSMYEVILESGGYGHEFITDFITYAISTCIVRNVNSTCHFRVLKYSCNVNKIHNYNWCAFIIKCLNDAVSEWKRDKTKFFMGLLLFLIVQFRVNKVERWFPVAINWPTEKVRKRDRDEQLPGEYGKGRTIERIDYHNVASLIWRCICKNCKRTNPNREDLVSYPRQLQLESNNVHIVHIAMDDAVPITNDPVQDNVTTVARAQQGKKATQMHTQGSQPYTSDIACEN
ncbi:hypothetical protein Cgig2_017979 [Carnegiea gigantea]|uniref:Uncharacterized protein n=1 Tax=Carnegiea gigantea TaxID=171969 RepID=A0A9Q1Q612_9CARY|nr:hypothetical protein Cgig2_017979 [Carnegiea gigantea]